MSQLIRNILINREIKKNSRLFIFGNGDGRMQWWNAESLY